MLILIVILGLASVGWLYSGVLSLMLEDAKGNADSSTGMDRAV